MNFENLIGIPFLDGGRDEKGLDCWGLAKLIYKKLGIDLPDYHISAMSPIKIGTQMKKEESDYKKIDEPEMYCLVVIQLADDSWANHVGIYIGKGRFIHAYRKTGVVTDKVSKWRNNIVGFYVKRR